MRLIRDVMSTSVITASPETPLKDVARLLSERSISGVPVVDADDEVLGVVSEADYVLKEGGSEGVPRRPLARLFGESEASRRQLAKIEATTAGEAMTSPAVTIESSASITEAARLMAANRINRLPVVDDGRLVGIVSRADLVRSYVRSDDELAAEVRDDVILRVMFLDPARFTVDVQDGVVSISGEVEQRSMAASLERAIAMVPGVVSVDADIRWLLDDSDIRPVITDPVFPHGPI